MDTQSVGHGSVLCAVLPAGAARCANKDRRAAGHRILARKVMWWVGHRWSPAVTQILHWWCESFWWHTEMHSSQSLNYVVSVSGHLSWNVERRWITEGLSLNFVTIEPIVHGTSIFLPTRNSPLWINMTIIKWRVRIQWESNEIKLRHVLQKKAK